MFQLLGQNKNQAMLTYISTKSRLSTINTAALLIFFSAFILQEGSAQRFNSLVGARIGYKTAAFSAKIALDEHNYLAGSIGVITPQPDYTVGAGIAYHRHIALNESKNFQFYYGVSTKAVIGDVSSLGVGLDAGLIYIYKSISVGLDVFPTYFFNEALGFKPLFGLNLRWVND